MTEIKIDINGLERAVEKLKKIPAALDKAMTHTMVLSLLELWSAVRPYPPKPPKSTYSRTGTLGRTLGSGTTGGRSGGQPTVYSIRGGGNKMTGHFGPNLKYAKYVHLYVVSSAFHIERVNYICRYFAGKYNPICIGTDELISIKQLNREKKSLEYLSKKIITRLNA